jgi:hypothetical protein
MDLHRACVTGKLFEFATAYLEMEEGWRSLLGNPYPLSGTLEVKGLVEGQERTGMGMGMGKSGEDGADELLQQIESQKGWCEVM